MKIAFLVPDLAPYRAHVFNALKATSKHDFVVYSMTEKSPLQQGELETLDFFFRRMRGKIVRFRTPWAGPTYWTFNTGVVNELIRGNYDLIICLCWTQPYVIQSLLAARKSGARIYLWDDSIPHTPGFLKRLLLPLIRHYFRRFDGYLAGSTLSKHYFYSMGVDPDKVFLFPNVVDANRFAPVKSTTHKGAIRQSLGIPVNKQVFLFVGQFIARKGLHELLAAWKKAGPPNSLLVAVGSGELEASIKKNIAREKLEDSVLLPGPITNAELAGYYQAADVFLLPSHYDTFAIVVAEAMSVGLPVIVSDQIGAAGDIVRDGKNGIIVPARDIEKLATSIQYLAQNPERAAVMGAVSQEIMQQWNIHYCLTVFEQCLRDKGKA